MQALCEIASSRPFSPGLLWKSFLVVLAHYRPNLCLLNKLSAKWSKIANFSVNASLVVGGGETTTNNLHKQCPLTFYAPKQNACILQWMLRLLNYYSPDNGAGGEGEIITGMVQTTEAHSNLQPSILKNIRSRCTFLCSLRPRIRFYPIIIG